jgi:predicted nucleic acid-binding Zn ribbon protein
MKIRRREMEDLLSFGDALSALSWPVAEHYRVFKGVLYADGQESGYAKSLSTADLFLSFSRLGAHGNPSEGTIKNWVREHGLLREQHEAADEDDLGAPIKLDEFRAEVREAYDALTLLEALRGGDIPALRARIGRKRFAHPETGKLVNEAGEPINSAKVLVDGAPIPYISDAAKEFSDDEVLHISEVALEYFVESKLEEGVRIGFIRDHDPRRNSFYDSRPRLAPYCKDLLGALWLQFALLVEDRRPWRKCAVCGNLFLATRVDNVICGTACRKRKSRKKRGQRGT